MYKGDYIRISYTAIYSNIYTCACNKYIFINVDIYTGKCLMKRLKYIYIADVYDMAV